MSASRLRAPRASASVGPEQRRRPAEPRWGTGTAWITNALVAGAALGCLVGCANGGASHDGSGAPSAPVASGEAEAAATPPGSTPTDAAPSPVAGTPAPATRRFLDAPPASEVIVLGNLDLEIHDATVAWSRPAELRVEVGADGTRSAVRAQDDDRWLVTVRAPAYAPVTRLVVRPEPARPVIVRLVPRVTVRGQVTDDAGVPVAGALVSFGGRASPRDEGGALTVWSADVIALTGSMGTYQLTLGESVTGLAWHPSAGEGVVGVCAEGFEPAASAPTRQGAGANWYYEADVVLRRGRTVRGRVVSDDDGQPVVGAAVQLAGPPGPAPWPPTTFGGRSGVHITQTSGDGTFDLDGCPSGTSQFAVAAPGFEPVVVTIEVSGERHVHELRIRRKIAVGTDDGR